ncbi:LysR family transcriptional regulator [Mycobacterium sp. E1214]|nr:LysR family transcriptional regulator [Mycobacterium sp. E1214]OBH25611.1 LysR family transcriptional regulator [Mycobacterium sp. E1319]
MNLRQLRYFVAVADENNFGRAAQRLRIAGPSLSQQIKALERDLKVRLFERNQHAVRLTPIGAHLLPHARALLAQADDLRRRAIGMAGTDPVRFGLVQQLPPGWADMIGAVAPVVFDAWVMPSPAQVTRVATGTLDVALCHVTAADLGAAGLAGQLAETEPLQAVSPGIDGRPVCAEDTAVLIDEDAVSWSAWNGYAAEFADRTGARVVFIRDGGVVGRRFFEHVQRLGCPVLSAPKARADVLPHNMSLRRVVNPSPLWTWTLVRRCDDDRPAVLALVDALTQNATPIDYSAESQWLPNDDPYHRLHRSAAV